MLGPEFQLFKYLTDLLHHWHSEHLELFSHHSILVCIDIHCLSHDIPMSSLIPPIINKRGNSTPVPECLFKTICRVRSCDAELLPDPWRTESKCSNNDKFNRERIRLKISTNAVQLTKGHVTHLYIMI